MPSETARQHRAMEAAAHGEGKIGIPAGVAKEFVAADEAKAHKRKAVAVALSKKG